MVLIALCLAVCSRGDVEGVCEGEHASGCTTAQNGGGWREGLQAQDSHGRQEVDMVFLVETQEPPNSSRSGAVYRALSTLLERSCRHEYEDFDVRYALLTYDTGSVRLAQSLTSVCTAHQLERVFVTPITPKMVRAEDTMRVEDYKAHTNASESQQERDFLTAERTLWVITAVLEKRNIPHLELRPNADLHLVAFSDLDDSRDARAPYGSSRAADDGTPGSWLPLIARVLDRMNTNSRVAVHIFLDGDNSASTSVFGKPTLSADARYADCTHLNRATALKSLIRAGSAQANTLQAHLLSRGLYAEVHELGDLNRAHCVTSLNPAIWSVLSLWPSFPDKCPLGDAQCAKGTFCSPLHGCTQLNVGDNSTAAESQEKAPPPPPLAPFGTSHADLAAVLTSNDSNAVGSPAPSGLLSILDDPLPSSPHAHLSDVVIGEPTILTWEPDRPFIAEVVKGGVPVVLKNSVVEAWPARHKWNMTYLAEKMDTEVLPAVKCSSSYLTFDPDKRTPLKLNLSLPFSVANMSKDTFFQCVQQPSSCPDGLVGHYYFAQVPEPLRQDLMPDRKLYLSERDHEARKQFMWISSEGMITHGHFDQDYNIFVQLVGVKRFTLWSPSQHDLLYPYPRIHPMWHKSRINFRSPDLLRFPQFGKSQAQQVVLTPGMVLFVPPYTWHYVETLSPSVSLSTWSHDYFLYDHMNAVYRHDHSFDLIKRPKGVWKVTIYVGGGNKGGNGVWLFEKKAVIELISVGIERLHVGVQLPLGYNAYKFLPTLMFAGAYPFMFPCCPENPPPPPPPPIPSLQSY